MTTSSTGRFFQRTARLDFLDGLGIAIHQRSVALAHLVKRLATVTLQHHRIVPLPPPDQTDARRAALAAAVAGFVAEHSLDADRTFVTLPRASALLSRLSLPAAAKSDLSQVLEFEIDRARAGGGPPRPFRRRGARDPGRSRCLLPGCRQGSQCPVRD